MTNHATKMNPPEGHNVMLENAVKDPLLNQMINQLPGLGIHWKNREGVYIGCNEVFARLTGHASISEIVGKTCHEILPKKMAELCASTDKQVLEEGASTRNEEETLSPDGEKRWVEIMKAPVRDHSNKIVGVVGVIRDISDQKRSDAALRSAQKLESLGVMAGGIAHDFNNILVGVLGNASLAIKKLPENSEVRKLIEDIMASADNASKLTSQLLAYSGKGRFIVQPINLSQQVMKIERLLQHSVSKSTELVFELDEELPLINADASQIHQVILNLVTNASEALDGKQGTVKIETGVRMLTHQHASLTFSNYKIESGRYVFLRVSDTGCGMTQKTTEKMFDPFFTTKFAGRGLGLPAVQGIVIAHCGTIQVESKIGKGTSIEVCFPAAEGDAAVAAPETTEAPAKRERHKTKIYTIPAKQPPAAQEAPTQLKGTILVVDDENVVRTVASHILDEFGMKVLTADNGKKAIDIYKRNPSAVDVILLDMTMPVMNGAETFLELRKVNPAVKVILTSGYSVDEVKLNFENTAEPAGFLEKPFTSQALSKIINDVLTAK